MRLKECTNALTALVLAKQRIFRAQIYPKRQNILHGLYPYIRDKFHVAATVPSKEASRKPIILSLYKY